MKATEKLKVINNWLRSGYSVKQTGSIWAAIWKNDKYYCWNNYGSSAVKANQKELKYLLTKIFDSNDDFYIIDNGKFICTNEAMEKAARQEYTFTFKDRDNNRELFEVTTTFENIIANYDTIAEKWSKKNPAENVVRFDVLSNFPYRYLIAFAI